jgi:hypothetical protein
MLPFNLPFQSLPIMSKTEQTVVSASAMMGSGRRQIGIRTESRAGYEAVDLGAHQSTAEWFSAVGMRKIGEDRNDRVEVTLRRAFP